MYGANEINPKTAQWMCVCSQYLFGSVGIAFMSKRLYLEPSAISLLLLVGRAVCSITQHSFGIIASLRCHLPHLHGRWAEEKLRRGNRGIYLCTLIGSKIPMGSTGHGVRLHTAQIDRGWMYLTFGDAAHTMRVNCTE